MKEPVPAPYRLAELRERVIASLGGMDDERRLAIIQALAGGLDDPKYHPWEYYVRAEPVPEGLTREARWCAVRSSGRSQEKRSGSSPSRPR